MRDEIDYEPPSGFVGRAVAPLLIESRLRKLSDYRHQVTRHWCEKSKELRMRGEGEGVNG